MKKDYKPTAKRNTARRAQAGNVLPFFSGLALGLLVAFVVYLQDTNPIDDTPVTANPAPQPEATTQPDKPRFDFYTILPEREVKVPSWEVIVPNKQAPKQTNEPTQAAVATGHVLQVGSFKQVKDADRTKASLALLGHSAHIERVVINDEDTRFRVRMGPFHDPERLDSVREQLNQERVEFITLRMEEGTP